MKRQIGLMIAGPLAAWLLVAYPARQLGGDQAVIFSAVAAGLCLLPTALTLLWAGWAFRQSPDQQLLMMLGGTVVRMAGALGGGLVFYAFVPAFAQPGFLIWLLVFYLFTLALEIILLVAGRPDARGQE